MPAGRNRGLTPAPSKRSEHDAGCEQRESRALAPSGRDLASVLARLDVCGRRLAGDRFTGLNRVLQPRDVELPLTRSVHYPGQVVLWQRRRSTQDPQVGPRRMPDDRVLVVFAHLEDPVVPVETADV